MAFQAARKLTANHYTVGWICALPLELTASEGMLDKVHEGLQLAEGDKNTYVLGEINGHNIAMTCLPAGSIGQTSAATVATDMRHSFSRIQFGLMVGIGGGAPNPSARPDEDIRLGDVVVSIPTGELGAVIKYDQGKVVAGGEFQHTGILNVPPSVLTSGVSILKSKPEILRNAITRSITEMIEKNNKPEDAKLEPLQKYQHPGAEYDQLFEADYEHVERTDPPNPVLQTLQNNEDDPEYPCSHCDEERMVPRRPRRKRDPVIHYGTIASADVVMRHGETREKLRQKYGILCFEMEAGGLMNHFPCLVIRGICDYSDTHKHKTWQPYAAATAAAYAKELLGTVQRAEAIEPRSEETREEIEKIRKELEDMKKGKSKFNYKFTLRHTDIPIDREQQGQKQKRDEILDWLDADTHTKKWADSRMKRHRDTGKAFVESQSFLHWVKDHTQTLWCHGIAGSGKTIFASLVIDHLHAEQAEKASNEKAAVVCLYLEYERMQEQSLQSLLAAILRQLVQQCPQIPKSVTELHKTHTEFRSQPLLEEINSVMADVLQKFPQAFLVVDALDECSEDTIRELLSNLRSHQKSTGMKILATSRPTVDFKEFFEDYDSMEIKALVQDVKAVLDALIIKLPRLVREDKRLQVKIKNSIVEAVDGMFVLVEPFLYSLRSERTVGDINDALKALKESPDKISTVYERTLKRIDGHFPKDQQMARRILSWIILAKRPLSCQELQHACNVRIGSDFDQDYFQGNLEESVALCLGLVVINKKSDSVQLMHHTAKIYFQDSKNQPEWIFSAKETIIRACVSYLSFSAFSKGPCSDDRRLRSRLKKFPFLEYAAQEWGNHLRESADAAVIQAENQALRFLEMEPNIWSSHQVLHLPGYRYSGYSQHFIKGANGLQLAAAFGLIKIVGQLLENGIDIAATDEDGGTALHRAAENGHVDVVMLLLHKGADINFQKKKQRLTALHLAALNGHSAVVKSLLQEGAQADLQDDDGWTALHVAAWTGKIVVINVLLEFVDVHQQGKDGVTALHCAAGQGRRDVVEMLIERGADVNTKDAYGWTALHWASKKRHEWAKLRQLEFKDESTTWGEQMKKVTKVTGMLRDTFNLPKKLVMMGKQASEKHWEDDLAYATDGFALDLKTNDRGMLTTLYFSTKIETFVPPWLLPKSEDQIPTVRLILAVQDELAALQCLFQCGHGSVAELLVKRGADINANCRAVVATNFLNMKFLKMSAKPTALHIAGLSGHRSMVQMLLDMGADTESLCEVGIGEDWLCADLTALHCAVVSGNKEVITLFLDRGADIDATCRVHFKNIKAKITSLHLAIIWGHTDVVKLLLARGGNTTTPCLINADKGSKSKEIRHLKLNFNIRTEIELPIVHLASIFGKQHVISELLKKGADCTSHLQAHIDIFDFSFSALHVASFLGHSNAVRTLLDHGALVDAKAELGIYENCRLGLNALQLAALSNSRQVVRLLLRKGANVHTKGHVENNKNSRMEWSPLHIATLAADAMIVGLLVEAGADVHEKMQGDMDSSYLPLTTESFIDRAVRMFAALLGDEFIPSSVLEKTSPPQGTDEKTRQKAHFELNALHLAVISKSVVKVKLFLQLGAEVNSKFIIKAEDLLLEAIPLHLATIWQDKDVATRLIKAGSDVQATLPFKISKLLSVEVTPLHLASLAENGDTVHGLLQLGAKDTSAIIRVAQMRVEMSAIHFAAINGSTAVTQLLLDDGSNVGLLCNMEFHSIKMSLTALHIAATFKHAPLLSLLVKYGANVKEHVHVKSKIGNSSITPLHLALMLKGQRDRSDPGIPSWLIKQGAFVSIPFRVDFIPGVHVESSVLHLAAISGDWKLVGHLIQSGADVTLRASLSIHTARLDISLLPFATLWGGQEIVRELIKSGADVNEACTLTIGTQQKVTITALHLAVCTGNEDIARFLLQKGAISHLVNKDSEGSDTQSNVSPLHLAILRGKQNVVNLLIEHGASILPSLQIVTKRSRIVLSALILSGLRAKMSFIKELVKKGVDVNATSVIRIRNVELRLTALTVATFDRRKNVVVYLLKHGADVHQPLEINFGSSSVKLMPLHLATLVHARKLVRILLKYKADARAPLHLTGKKWYITGTSLHLSSLYRDARDIVELLLSNGAKIQDKFQVGIFSVNAEMNAIHLAIGRGSQELLKTLLKNRENDDASLRFSLRNLGMQLSSFHLALLLKREALVELLIAEGIDIHAPYTVGVSKKFQTEISALHLTTLCGKDGVPGLSQNGVDLHARSLASVDTVLQFELSILDVMTMFGTREVTESFKKMMQDNEIQQDGLGKNLALYLATALGYKPVLKLLLERTDEIDKNLSVTIHATVAGAFEGKTSNRIDTTVELKIHTELSVLHLATILGNVDAAQLLIDKGADINSICQIRVEDGLQADLTPLMLATMWKHDGMVQLMLKNGAKVSHIGKARFVRTVNTDIIAPHLSAILGYEGVNRVLRKVDNIEAKINAELTTLHLAAVLDDASVISRLLEHGADPDMRCQIDIDAKHQSKIDAHFQLQLTPLHLAAWAGHENNVTTLLVKGEADVDAKIQAGGKAALDFGLRINKKMQPGGTALHIAIGLGKVKVAQTLINNGADISAKTRDGRTALKCATDGQNGESIAQAIGLRGMEESTDVPSKDVKDGFVRKLRKAFYKRQGNGKQPKEDD